MDDLLVEGNIKTTQDIADHTRNMQGDRDTYNWHKHDIVGHSTAVPTSNKQQLSSIFNNRHQRGY
ncbi:hypothetical protein [Spartinivicinus ruber]|uniref:hypothetical protein n=1 Tax=Spartinivicinus ruber TaxID=2683272 RepID=UPI0013D20360|nr:hypothetical protein [Spartinivicinus ruber]